MFVQGERVGAYTILRQLGVGGMGAVYLAKHRHIGRLAAIKVLLRELSARDDVVSRFFNEARATALLRHPNIVEIIDCDVHSNGLAYIVMEFLSGETLGECLARVRRLEERTALAIAGQAASALAVAHGKGIIHRDLKPDNVFLAHPTEVGRPLDVKILDFGIAKLAYEGAEAKKTRTGNLLGTPLYMSPEQCKGAGRVDHRADVYSLGCIMFELISGRPPFIREGAGELIVAHVSEPPPQLAGVMPSVAPPLNDLIMAMLAKNPEDRPARMASVVARIESFLGVSSDEFNGLVGIPEGFPRRHTTETIDAAAEGEDAVQSHVPQPSRAHISSQGGGTAILPRKGNHPQSYGV